MPYVDIENGSVRSKKQQVSPPQPAQPTPDPFTDFFNLAGVNQPAAPAPQPAPNNFLEAFNNLIVPQPAQPVAPVPAPIVEQPVNP